MQKFYGVLAVFLCVFGVAEARPDYYTQRDVICADDVCKLRDTEQPVNGQIKLFYGDGKVRALAEYRNGRQSGKALDFFKSGRVHRIAHYRNGKENGIVKAYYESGNLEYEYEVADGVREGYDRSYYADGQLRKETNYRRNQKEGAENLYYENGDVLGRINYSGGQALSGYCFRADKSKVNMNTDLTAYMQSGKTPCE